MPKISAPTVAEHVAQQEAAVFDAAIGLFVERGYANVTMTDIAAAVGLARNSLYRYFPDKAHIMVRWFETELPVQVEAAARALGGEAPIETRVARYVGEQFDYATAPAHELITSLVQVVPVLGDDVRQSFMASHRALLMPLDDALAREGLDDPGDRAVVADLIQGLISAGVEREQRTGRDERVRARVVDSILRMITSTNR